LITQKVWACPKLFLFLTITIKQYTMATLKMYFYEGPYQFDAYDIEVDTIGLFETAAEGIADAVSKLKAQYQYRPTRESLWAICTVPSYGDIRISRKEDGNFYTWDTIADPGTATWKKLEL